jgi:hypothetical protein
MWHCIQLGEHHAIVGARLLQRLQAFILEAAARVTLPDLAIFSSPLPPFDSETLYLAPGTMEFLRPAVSDLAPEPCDPPTDPDGLGLFFHYGVEDPFVRHFGREPSDFEP